MNKMQLLDIIVFSFSQSEKLNALLKEVFKPNKFILYKINENDLLKKNWYSSFRFLVIDDHPMSFHDKILDIVKTAIYDRKQIILISEKIKPELLKFAVIDDMKIETLNDDVIIVNRSELTYMILYNNLDSLAKYTNFISELWQLDMISNNDISLIHSDIYIISSTKEDKQQYLRSLTMKISENDSKVQFQYNNKNFVVHLTENSLDNHDSNHKLFTAVNEKNNNFEEIISFQKEDYFSALYTKSLGKIVLFAEVLSSSFDLMEKLIELGNYHPLVIISYVQIQGKGRGDNKWISPSGCAMFTCLVPISIKSKLGKSVSLIQHIMAVSIVEALNSVCWIDNKALKIKWPNDIYWEKRGKISGVLLKAVMQDDSFYCMIGCGINVSNSEPTVCVYDIIKELSKELRYKETKCPSIEQVIAHVMTRLESNILRIQNSDEQVGIEHFKEKYYKYWMHSDQIVMYKNSDNEEFSGRVIGINDYGFLEICSDDRSVVTLHPDGNSFDMMHGLIRPK